MDNFQQFDLPNKLLQTLKNMGFSKPTSIQQQCIIPTLERKDVLGTAQTGTGKTGAFAIPLTAELLTNPSASILVLTPTRELATQVVKVFKQLLASDKSIKSTLLIGGDSMIKQLQQLQTKPKVIIGTPGRINDHLKRGSLNLKQITSLVLDETDLMLDMGFDVQIATIINKIQTKHQTLMFSATLPPKIENITKQYLQNPIRIQVGQESTPVRKIEQDSVFTSEQDKYSNLTAQLEQRDGSVIIFVKTKRGADKLSIRLNKEHYSAKAIHGDLRQSKREVVLKGFRNQKYRILVATDVAARGIDVPHIRHVINYDIPQCKEDYVHRIGRTARAGETGSAISFITKSDQKKWYAIERLFLPSTNRENSNKLQSDKNTKRKSRNKYLSSNKKKWNNKKTQTKNNSQHTATAKNTKKTFASPPKEQSAVDKPKRRNNTKHRIKHHKTTKKAA